MVLELLGGMARNKSDRGRKVLFVEPFRKNILGIPVVKIESRASHLEKLYPSPYQEPSCCTGRDKKVTKAKCALFIATQKG